MRRLPVVALALAFLVCGIAPRPAHAALTSLKTLLDSRLAEFSGEAGIVVADGRSGQLFYEHGADEIVIAASLYKLGVLVEAERRVEAKQLRYSDTLTIAWEDINDDGSFFYPGSRISLDEALEMMITVSDNGSALALQRIFTALGINETLRSLGIQPFALQEDPDQDYLVSPRAVATYFTLLAQGRLVSPAASERMLQRLARQEINDRLPAQLPAGTRVAHKTGNLGFATHDAGVVYQRNGDPVVVVAMTWDSPEDEAIELIQDLGSLVYEHAATGLANVGYGLPQQAVNAPAGRSMVQGVRLTNLGPADWTLDPAGVLGLLWEVSNAAGSVVARNARPITLWDVKAGATIEVPVILPVPAEPGEYRVSFGLSDPRHGALASLGAATGTMTLRVHNPYLVELGVQLSPLLHRDEASAAIVSLVPTRDLIEGTLLRLGWRALDPRNGRVLAQGDAPLAAVNPGKRASVLVPLVAPALRGSYLLELFALAGGKRASAALRKTVLIAGPRTYPGELGTAQSTPPRPRPTPVPGTSR